ncbi:MAG: ABC transporter permease subunit [Planctomycetes bacterium]|nr:ABC transporter permease subunit [Planctomycetota bacterium]
MHSVLVLARKEFRQMFLSPIAYAFLFVFVLFVTFMFFRTFFLYQVVSLNQFFEWFPLAYTIVIPGITMRTWAEERNQGTIEFLLTSPIETWQIVLAKFLSGLGLVALCLLLTIGVPLTVAGYGDLDPGPVWGGYLGALLMGGTCLAIGMFFSAFTRDQIVAFLLGVTVLLALVLLGFKLIQDEFAPAAPPAHSHVSSVPPRTSSRSGGASWTSATSGTSWG